MTNEIAKTNGSRELATLGDNPFTTYGEQTRQTAIIGSLLKFTKGDFVKGEANEPVDAGSQFVANMDQLLVGFVRWSNNRPTDHVMGRVATGYQKPTRSSLGDNDQSQWEVDDSGQARDPWQETSYLLLQDADDELLTFTTSSTGGRNAIGDLCIKYGKAMRQHPDAYPIIEIGVGSYMHSNKSFGRIKFPTFTIVGWKPKSEFITPDTADRSSEVETAPAPKDPPVKVAPAAAAKATAKPVPKGKGKTRF